MRTGRPLTSRRLGPPERRPGGVLPLRPRSLRRLAPPRRHRSGGRAMSRLGPQEENLQGSWVELHFSSNGNGSGNTVAPMSQEQVPASISIHNGDMEKILLDAQHESGRSSSRESSHCDSPPRSQTPQDSHRALEIESHSSGEKNSFQSEEDFLERRREVERLLKKNADWIWDWSSRPENIPPKEFLFKHPRRTATLSMRNTSVMKKGGIFSAEFLKVFLPSLLLSHLLAIGLGVYIGRRLTTTAASSTF
ncbi:LOW QUALITY PROTEIN: BCL2/adenovirus E1B 19 kDa protein-interacting protein 3 [Cariama cristata]